MKVFLSYRCADWEALSKALGGDRQDGFFPRLEKMLRSKLGANVDLQMDVFSQKNGLEWPKQIKGFIDKADVFVVLYSKNWLESDVCWSEYQHAAERPEKTVLVPILYQPFEFASANIPNDRQKAATNLDAAIRRKHLPEMDYNFVRELATAYGRAENREGAMYHFVEPFVDRILNCVETPEFDVVPVPTAQPALVPTKKTIKIGEHKVRFVKIPAGQFTCRETGNEHQIETPFFIMQKPMKAAQLFSGMTQILGRPMTFADLIPPRQTIPGLPTRLSLPSEDQWDLAFIGGCGDYGNFHTNLRWADHPFGLHPAPNQGNEPVYGFANPRRPVTDLYGPDAQNLGFKSLRPNQVVRKKALRDDKPLNSSFLRLVLSS